MNKKTVSMTAIILTFGLVFLYLVLGLYRYDNLNQTPVKINRITGETWLLSDAGVWMNHNAIEEQKKANEEADVKMKDIPKISLIPLIENLDIYPTDSQSVKARKVQNNIIYVGEGATATIDAAVQKLDIWWDNYNIDTIRITINGRDLGASETTIDGNYFYSNVEFNSGVNQIVIQTSRGTYKYFVKYDDI
ncbi:hypothetical protein M3194_20865 [Paenibacillus glycanilyticus]|uniref:hypothetical protein n=1 Tax=Paenibacillus glycanilyticus TaxID=126569 RepID=UPI0020408EA5|nr:hypothetical protein [Paenibacillus glycanilyticus]MCM3629795.1 hypothetical protein [Paenibacillus glycanilyticus]